MDFNGKAVLVYLEEDNIPKAYFRIKPLLSEDGPISAEMLAELPDEGFLRIVPDRNEQHTFKERMRSMCGLCMLDLRNQPPEANKIRTNKNYAPANGENNQYIVYSDAVRAMEESLLYQVVSQNDAEKAVTPFVYIRNGANMQGPVKKDEPSLPENAKQLPPDSQQLFSISVNGQELLFFWPREVQKNEEMPSKSIVTSSADKEEITEAPLSALDQIQEINKQCVTKASTLLSPQPSEETLQKSLQPQQLTGTKLYSPGQRNNSFRRVHNPLIETVELQRYASKQEAPGAVVNDSSALKDVLNPVDAFKRSMQKVCLNAEDSRQAVDIILSCPGMQQALSAAMSVKNNNFALTAMQSQLQEMEAERLMLLMQLDDAKKDMANLKKESLKELTDKEKAALEELRNDSRSLEAANIAQQNALIALNTKRQEAQDMLEKAINDGNTVLLMRPVGRKTEKEELVRRLEDALKASGFICKEGDALALLTAYALSPDVLHIYSSNNADAALAAKAFAGIFGAAVSMNKNEKNVLLAPGGNTPTFVRALPRKDCTCILLKDDIVDIPTDYAFAMLLFEADLQAVPQDACISEPACLCSINAFISDSKLNEETIAAIQALRNLQPDSPLPIDRVKNALRFIASLQNTLKGGVAEAIDRAVAIFILPHYLFCGIKKDVLSAHLTGLTRSLKIWDEVK